MAASKKINTKSKKGKPKYEFDLLDIPTTSLQEIKGFSNFENLTTLQIFKKQIDKQKNFFKWLDSKIDTIDELVEKSKGEKKNTARNRSYAQYLWYLRKLLLLDIINSFETFYKNIAIDIANILTIYIDEIKVKGSVEKSLILKASDSDIINLIFESDLYHSISSINDITNVFFQYCSSKQFYSNDMRTENCTKKIRCKNDINKINLVFQIRHTLSHNNGFVTVSDAKKIKVLSGKVKEKETIDPSKNIDIKNKQKNTRVISYHEAICKFLYQEASEFNDWVIERLEESLDRIIVSGKTIQPETIDKIKKRFGFEWKLKDSHDKDKKINP